jgi:hypothetical protein
VLGELASGCNDGVALAVDEGVELTANGAALGIELNEASGRIEGVALVVANGAEVGREVGEAPLGCMEGVELAASEVGKELLGEAWGCIEGAALAVGEAVIMVVVGRWVTSVKTPVGDVLGVALCEGDASFTTCIVGASVGGAWVGLVVTMFEVGDVVVSLTGQSKVSGIAGQSQLQLDAESEKQQSGTPLGAVSHSGVNGVVDWNPDGFLFSGTLCLRLRLLLRDEMPLH